MLIVHTLDGASSAARFTLNLRSEWSLESYALVCFPSLLTTPPIQDEAQRIFRFDVMVADL